MPQLQQRPPEQATAPTAPARENAPTRATSTSTTSTSTATAPGPGLGVAAASADGSRSFQDAVKAGDSAAARAAWDGMGPEDQAAIGTDRAVLGAIAAWAPFTGSAMLKSMGFDPLDVWSARAPELLRGWARALEPAVVVELAADRDGAHLAELAGALGEPAGGALRARVAAWTSQGAPTEYTDGPTIADIRGGAVLRVGHQGLAVGTVQERLMELGYPVGRSDRFGPTTELVVREFQARTGLPATGTVDAATLGKMARDASAAPKSPEPKAPAAAPKAPTAAPKAPTAAPKAPTPAPVTAPKSPEPKAPTEAPKAPAPAANAPAVAAPAKPAHPEAVNAAPNLDAVRSGAHVLKVGDYGTAVAVLQGLLGLPVNRVYTASMKTAVERWQKANKVGATGMIGKQTLEKLMPALGPNRPLVGVHPEGGGFGIGSTTKGADGKPVPTEANRQLAAVEANAGKKADIIQTYRSIGASSGGVTADLEAIFAHGSIAHLNIEPYSGGKFMEQGVGKRQTTREDYTDDKLVERRAHLARLYELQRDGKATPAQLAELTSLRDSMTGKRDEKGARGDQKGSDYIMGGLRDMGFAVRKAMEKHPQGRVIITLGAEMNGAWLGPKGEGAAKGALWGQLSGGDYQALYKAGYQVIKEALGETASRAEWAWGPDSQESSNAAEMKGYFPGLEYTDYIGSSSYARGKDKSESAAAILKEVHSLQRRLGLTDAQVKGKMMLLQTATHRDASDDSEWIADLMRRASNDPRIAALIYFNVDGGNIAAKQWKMDTGSEAMLGEALAHSGGPPGAAPATPAAGAR